MIIEVNIATNVSKSILLSLDFINKYKKSRIGNIVMSKIGNEYSFTKFLNVLFIEMI